MAEPSTTASRASSASSLGFAASVHLSIWKCWSCKACVSSWDIIHAFVGRSVPIGNEKFLAVRVVEAGNLLGEHLHQRLFQRITFREQAEFLHTFLIGVALVSVLVLFHFLQ